MPSSQTGAQQPQPSSPVFLGVVKRVILSASKVGLEEAGTRILGPTAWKYARAVLEPVFTELLKQFPALASTGTPQAEAAAVKAADLLASETRLQNVLVSGFAKLELGQAEIVMELTRVNNVLAEIGEDVQANRNVSAEILQQLEIGRRETPALVPANEFEPRAGESSSQALAREFVRWGYWLERFAIDVLENGKAFVTYSRILPSAMVDGLLYVVPTEYRASAAAPFQEHQQTCRDVSVNFEWQRKWHQQLSSITYCRVRGHWERQSNE